MMEKRFIVTSSPHMTTASSTRRIMLDVIIALLPAGIAGCVMFGWYSAVLIVSTVAAAVVFEYLFRKLTKRENSVGDLSAVVTGLLLAYNLPPKFPVWMAVIGAFTAIVIVKQCFGGIGQNFANPAITARIVLLVSFPTAMTAWRTAYDGVSSATPLAMMKTGTVLVPDGTTILGALVGNVDTIGCIGEVSRLLLLAGGLYLFIRKVITPVIPLCFIGTVGLLTRIFGADPVMQMLSGGLILGAVFMATDYATSPTNLLAKVIFGIGCGFFTVVIRLWSNLPEGVSYSILIMNVLTPLIEMATYPRPFGTDRKRRLKGPPKEAAKP
ncbi:MAG TPA: RnfABCDGE type electron transport complex subunit D [Oscillospiraceae bacterium]|nr:RnfABCDGE type electron transport complex subunit D [Oscillospiraceae bacterium]HPS34298.1 RnfABCDGE type electron transport complex subunit D [Oscillospiraceae bacterium]